jgi:hypothetical protein
MGLVTGVTIVEPSAPPDNGRSSFCKAIVPRLREAASTYDKLARRHPEGGWRCAEDGVAAGPEWSRGVGFGPRHTMSDTWPASGRMVGGIGGEFDPGSGSTLAACLMHASRTGRPSGRLRGGRVRNTWASRPGVGGSRRKRRVIPHVLACRWGAQGKGLRTRPGRRLRPIS